MKVTLDSEVVKDIIDELTTEKYNLFTEQEKKEIQKYNFEHSKDDESMFIEWINDDIDFIKKRIKRIMNAIDVLETQLTKGEM